MVVYNDIHKRFRSLLNNKHISQSEFQKVFKLEKIDLKYYFESTISLFINIALFNLNIS